MNIYFEIVREIHANSETFLMLFAQSSCWSHVTHVIMYGHPVPISVETTLLSVTDSGLVAEILGRYSRGGSACALPWFSQDNGCVAEGPNFLRIEPLVRKLLCVKRQNSDITLFV